MVRDFSGFPVDIGFDVLLSAVRLGAIETFFYLTMTFDFCNTVLG